MRVGGMMLQDAMQDACPTPSSSLPLPDEHTKDLSHTQAKALLEVSHKVLLRTLLLLAPLVIDRHVAT